MSYGALTRRGLLDRLSRVARAALHEAQEVGQISLRSAPKGIVHRGFAFVSVSSRDAGGRPRPGEVIIKEHTVTLRYAHRLSPHDQAGGRREATDAIDALELALRNSTDRDATAGEVVGFSSTEQQSPSLEWLVYDCIVTVRSLFQLQAPTAGAAA